MQTKYRVRDVETGKVVAYEYIDSANRWAWFPVDDPAVRPLEGTYPHSGIREQFTGLLDKNGVDYYQGDKVKGPTGMVSVVVYTNGGFWLHRVKSQSAMELYLEAEDSEVIGTSHDKEVDK